MEEQYQEQTVPTAEVQQEKKTSKVGLVKAKCTECLREPKLLITYLWLGTLAVSVMFVIGALVCASNNAGGEYYHSKAVGFAGIWISFLVVAIAAGGTVIMRKYQSAPAIALFLGVLCTLSFCLFPMGFVFGGAADTAKEAKEQGYDDAPYHPNEAMLVFSIMLSICYAIFAGVIFKCRAHIIRGGPSAFDINAAKNNILSGSFSSQQAAAETADFDHDANRVEPKGVAV